MKKSSSKKKKKPPQKGRNVPIEPCPGPVHPLPTSSWATKPKEVKVVYPDFMVLWPMDARTGEVLSMARKAGRISSVGREGFLTAVHLRW